MIEMQRTAPSRILKQREIAAQDAVLSAAPAAIAPIDAPTGVARPRASVAPPAPLPSASCVAKEARLVRGDDGSSAVEVRCSCGEWTRVELQLAEVAQ